MWQILTYQAGMSIFITRLTKTSVLTGFGLGSLGSFITVGIGDPPLGVGPKAPVEQRNHMQHTGRDT